MVGHTWIRDGPHAARGPWVENHWAKVMIMNASGKKKKF